MALLQIKDFRKPAGKGPYAGKSREQILALRIKGLIPFKIGSSTSKDFFGSGYDIKKFTITGGFNKIDVKKNKGLQTIKISQLYKDDLFGGGGGSGGGAEDTKYTESGQCYFNSLCFNVLNRPLKRTDTSLENLKKGAKFVQATKTVEDFYKNGPDDWIENEVYIKTANILFNNYKNKFKRPVYFHRGSKFMNDIYKAKQEVQKYELAQARKSGKLPQAPGSFSNDKWNPGDIWMSDLPPNSQPLKVFKDWSELNQSVLNEAGELKSKDANLLGVSLKKLGSTANIKKFNLPKRVNNISVPFKGFIFGKNGDFFSSIDMYFKLGLGEVQFRAFNSTSAWQGEIKGATAAGGKIGGGNLNYYLEKHLNKTIGNSGRGLSWKETPFNQVNLTKMYELYKKYNNLQMAPFSKNSFPVVSFSEFQSKVKGKSSFIFSKNMCLMFLDSFLSATKPKRDMISTEIIRYAASNTDVSSFFVKVF